MVRASIYGDLLGRPRLSWGDRPLAPATRKALALLCYTLAQGRPVPRGELSELLWRGRGAQSLRQALYTLRRLPGASEWLDPADPVVVRGTSDLHELESARARSDYRRILALWRGAFLDGLEVRGAPAWAEWIAQERTRLETVYLEALLGEARRSASEGRSQEALSLVRRFLERDDLDEEAYRTAMRICARDGDPGGALGWFERCRRRLWDELGVAPADETARLAREIEALAPSTASAEAPAAAIERREGSTGGWRVPDLNPKTQRVARALALAEPPPSVPILARVVDLDEFDVAEALDSLQQAGLLKDGELVDSALRDRIAAEVPEGSRRLLHLRIADALAEFAAAPARVAEHYLSAAEPGRALPYALSAGNDAAARFEDDEARARFRQALECEPELASAFEAWCGLESIARRRGDVEDVGEALDRLDALAEELQDDDALYIARLRRSEHLVEVGRPGDGGALAQEALSIARRLGDRARIDRARATIGIAKFRAGELTEARDMLARVSATDDASARVGALFGIGAVDGTRGDLAAAERAHAEALTIARAEGDVTAAGRLLGSLAATAERGARYAEAARRFDEALALAVRTRDPRAESVALLNLAEVRIRLGRFSSARAAAEAGLSLARRHDLARMVATGLLRHATLDRSLGRPEAAVPQFDEAAAAYAECGDERNVRVARFNLEIARAEAASQAALAPAIAALESLEQIGLDDIAAWAWVELALVTCDAGQARQWARRALLHKDNPHVRLLAALAEQRAAMICEPRPAPHAALEETLPGARVWEAAWGYALLSRCASGGEARAHAEEARVRVDDQARGLPGHLRRALRARLKHWLDGDL